MTNTTWHTIATIEQLTPQNLISWPLDLKLFTVDNFGRKPLLQSWHFSHQCGQLGGWANYNRFNFVHLFDKVLDGNRCVVPFSTICLPNNSFLTYQVPFSGDFLKSNRIHMWQFRELLILDTPIAQNLAKSIRWNNFWTLRDESFNRSLVQSRGREVEWRRHLPFKNVASVFVGSPLIDE